MVRTVESRRVATYGGCVRRQSMETIKLSCLKISVNNEIRWLKSKVYLRRPNVALSSRGCRRHGGRRVGGRSPDTRVDGSGPEGRRHRRHPRECVREAPEGVHASNTQYAVRSTQYAVRSTLQNWLQTELQYAIRNTQYASCLKCSKPSIMLEHRIR